MPCARLVVAAEVIRSKVACCILAVKAFAFATLAVEAFAFAVTHAVEAFAVEAFTFAVTFAVTLAVEAFAFAVEAFTFAVEAFAFATFAMEAFAFATLAMEAFAFAVTLAMEAFTFATLAVETFTFATLAVEAFTFATLAMEKAGTPLSYWNGQVASFRLKVAFVVRAVTAFIVAFRKFIRTHATLWAKVVRLNKQEVAIVVVFHGEWANALAAVTLAMVALAVVTLAVVTFAEAFSVVAGPLAVSEALLDVLDAARDLVLTQGQCQPLVSRKLFAHEPCRHLCEAFFKHCKPNFWSTGHAAALAFALAMSRMRRPRAEARHKFVTALLQQHAL